MIRIFTTGQEGERLIPLSEVNIHTQEICQWTSAPYILFEPVSYTHLTLPTTSRV